MSKESFKQFAKQHPEFIKYINNGEMTWQKFYELYDMYGDNSDIWNKYGSVPETRENNTSNLLGDTSLKDIFNVVKQIDLDTVKRGVDGLQKAVGLIQDITGNKSSNNQANYQRRPMYKYFED